MKRKSVYLTPKQIRTILNSLKSTASLRTQEKERQYLFKTMKELEEQTV